MVNSLFIYFFVSQVRIIHLGIYIIFRLFLAIISNAEMNTFIHIFQFTYRCISLT